MVQHKFEAIYQLSPSQQGILLDALSERASAAQGGEGAADSAKYIEISVYDIRGPLDVEAFHQAWQAVVARHPALRSGYVWEGQAEPLQFVLRRMDIPHTDHDCRALSSEEQARKVEAYIQNRRRAGFNLAKPPLLDVALFRLGDELHRFVLTIHHLLIDGWSLPILLHDFVACY